MKRQRGKTKEERHKRDGGEKIEGNRYRRTDREERWRGRDRGNKQRKRHRGDT